jgi:hypothetical protein
MKTVPKQFLKTKTHIKIDHEQVQCLKRYI